MIEEEEDEDGDGEEALAYAVHAASTGSPCSKVDFFLATNETHRLHGRRKGGSS